MLLQNRVGFGIRKGKNEFYLPEWQSSAGTRKKGPCLSLQCTIYCKSQTRTFHRNAFATSTWARTSSDPISEGFLKEESIGCRLIPITWLVDFNGVLAKGFLWIYQPKRQETGCVWRGKTTGSYKENSEKVWWCWWILQKSCRVNNRVPSTGIPKDHRHSQGLTTVWIWYSQAEFSSSSSSLSIPINSTGWKLGILLAQCDRCNTRSKQEEFIFKFISAGRIEMVIHSPETPLGSRITPPAAQHPCTPCMKELRVSCSGRIPVTGLPCQGNFAWAEKGKLPPELCGPTHTI